MLYRGKAILVRTQGKMYTVAQIVDVYHGGVKYQFRGNRRIKWVAWTDFDAYFSTNSNNRARILGGKLFVSETCQPPINSLTNHKNP